ncbi:copper amine oxidase N-terminal domain-containing protein [Neomoorella mulderi]|uniref:Copper amine oxidase-like N-terminal domain-containing protein n=1 Tax=Moorella mulderi DSM 14980 TaxID=1122241 RepID=A0A151ATQ9_9FIRM|nr:copper amine oxidase N-terminal domain-containing protein [Moorella mulderi]KYH30983.1 hypothetical protein MOMUL_27670 [Moorella mulderi DSM 14980]
MQRKLTATAFFFAFLFLLFAGASTAQAGDAASIAFMLGKSEYVIDNVMPVKTDAAPFAEQGRSFVPVRYLARALGVPDDKVSWSPSANTVTLITDNETITLAVDGKVMYVGEEAREMDVAPLLKEGRVYLPARYVAEALGYEVGWDDGSQVVYLWPKGDPRPDLSKAVELFKDWVWIDRGYKIPDPDGRLAYRDSVMPKYLYKTHAGVNIVPRFTDTIEMEIGVAPLNDGGTEEGYRQAEIILASKFGKEFAEQVAEYYREKTTIPYLLEGKDFYTCDNTRVYVMSATYGWINIIISHR